MVTQLGAFIGERNTHLGEVQYVRRQMKYLRGLCVSLVLKKKYDTFHSEECIKIWKDQPSGSDKSQAQSQRASGQMRKTKEQKQKVKGKRLRAKGKEARMQKRLKKTSSTQESKQHSKATRQRGQQTGAIFGCFYSGN